MRLVFYSMFLLSYSLGIFNCLNQRRIVYKVRKYAKIVQMTPLRLWRESFLLQKFSVTNREPLQLQKFSVTNIVLSLPFSQQIQFTLIVNVLIKSSKLKNDTAWQNRKRVDYDHSLLNDRHHGIELSRSADHHSYFVYVLESLKMAFFVKIPDSKYSKMTPKFVKQK